VTLTCRVQECLYARREGSVWCLKHQILASVLVSCGGGLDLFALHWSDRRISPEVYARLAAVFRAFEDLGREDCAEGRALTAAEADE
jgi:hypothetical protein